MKLDISTKIRQKLLRPGSPQGQEVKNSLCLLGVLHYSGISRVNNIRIHNKPCFICGQQAEVVAQ
jgi:hypothetical protein